jgi:predicted DNA-binding transcriptional regulator YafY
VEYWRDGDGHRKDDNGQQKADIENPGLWRDWEPEKLVFMPKVSRQVYSRPPMERMMRIHSLLQNGECPNCTSVGREFELSVRTVVRDIDFMRDRLNLPIEWDARRNGYYYTRPVEYFPTLAMSEAETFALLVASKAIAQYHGTPFQKPLETAFRRLTGQLDQGVRFSMGSVEQVLSFRPFAPDDADLRVFEVLTRAVRERRVLRFQYRNRGAAALQEREVHPYHVACIDNHWYLLAYDVKRAALRTFSLTRMQKPQLGKKRFTVSKRFDPDEYLRGSFGVYKGDAEGDYEVVVEFDAWAADEILGRRWHASQEIARLASGMVRLRMRLNNLEEVERWVMGFGTHATVVRPEVLRERLGKATQELAQRYGARSG